MRGRRLRCTTVSGTPEERWEQLYGTTTYGNLPQHKKHFHVGHCWAPCPYDIECNEVRTRNMLDLTERDEDGEYIYPLPTRTTHSGIDNKHYYMKTHSRGVWGFECTYSGCPYYLAHGKRYFYV